MTQNDFKKRLKVFQNDVEDYIDQSHKITEWLKITKNDLKDSE